MLHKPMKVQTVGGLPRDLYISKELKEHLVLFLKNTMHNPVSKEPQLDTMDTMDEMYNNITSGAEELSEARSR